MHTAGYVHGDIRDGNVVFHHVPKALEVSHIIAVNGLTLADLQDVKNPNHFASLIDFDFGGHVADDNPTYPPGYRKTLNDGRRDYGKHGSEISTEHDVAAWAVVLASLHELTDKSNHETNTTWLLLEVCSDLDQTVFFCKRLLCLLPKESIRPKNF